MRSGGEGAANRGEEQDYPLGSSNFLAAGLNQFILSNHTLHQDLP